jgi:hypothetical protein
MKKIIRVLNVIIVIFGLVNIASAKKMYVVNVDKGEMPNDISGWEVTLSEEYATTKGGLMLKVSSKGEGGWMGEYNPKRGIWDGYDYFVFNAYNPGKDPVSINLTIKPTPNCTYNDRFDQPIVLRPGKNKVEVPLAGATTNGGGAINWKNKISQWNINGSIKELYIGSFMLMTEDELEENSEKEKKGEKKK